MAGIQGLRRCPAAVAAAALLVCAALAAGRAEAAEEQKRPRDLTELSPEQLADLEVTSVAKKPQKSRRTPAAVYVITRETIRRSGVTTLVDALRLAPGIHVARIDSNKWAVGVRGFASSLTRSVLVMIDGRTVYTPLFAGVFWDVQDLLLEDVDRIEVIRGPGGSLWGANSVNGIINIITRSSRETQGAFVSAGGGTMERGLGMIRYGGGHERVTYRAYAKGFDRGPGFHPTTSEFDDWHMGQAGFRTDWERTQDQTVQVQGDIYRGDAGLRTTITGLTPPFLQTVEADTRLSGGNLLARWQHAPPQGAGWSLRAYYDRTDRHEPTFGEGRNTVDLDLQRHAAYGRNDLVLGLGYRFSAGTADGVPSVAFLPAHRADQLWTGFFRDELTFSDGRLVFALGSKLEHNDYSGFEVQPNVQALKFGQQAAARLVEWAGFSKVVRGPNETVTSATPEQAPGYVLTRGADIHGRCVAFVGYPVVAFLSVGHLWAWGSVPIDTFQDLQIAGHAVASVQRQELYAVGRLRDELAPRRAGADAGGRPAPRWRLATRPRRAAADLRGERRPRLERRGRDVNARAHRPGRAAATALEYPARRHQGRDRAQRRDPGADHRLCPSRPLHCEGDCR